MATIITRASIEAKRLQVRQAYAIHGFHSKEYQQSFDELHDLNMVFMAANFRASRGLPPDAKTPYCPNR